MMKVMQMLLVVGAACFAHGLSSREKALEATSLDIDKMLNEISNIKADVSSPSIFSPVGFVCGFGRSSNPLQSPTTTTTTAT